MDVRHSMQEEPPPTRADWGDLTVDPEVEYGYGLLCGKTVAEATPLFAEKGFNGVSVREIAGFAGVNVSMISYYFGGKEGLYAAVLNEQFGVLQHLSEITDVDAEPLAKLELYVRDTVARYRKHPDCGALVCFVYDPSHTCTNATAIETDVPQSSPGFPVTVLVGPARRLHDAIQCQERAYHYFLHVKPSFCNI